MNSVIDVDLTEIITVNPEVYPYPAVKELLKSVCDELFLVDTKLEELLPRFKQYADDNFGCQIEFHTLCTIEGHTSIQLTLRHFSERLEAETTFSLVHTRGLVNLLKRLSKQRQHGYSSPILCVSSAANSTSASSAHRQLSELLAAVEVRSFNKGKLFLIDFKHNQAKTVIAKSNMCMQHVDVHRYIRQQLNT